MGGELSGWGKMMLLCNNTDWFRAQRKWFAHDLGTHAAVAKLHRMIEVETRRYLRSALEEPDRIRAHVRKYVCSRAILSSVQLRILYRNLTSISLRLSHGYITHEGDDTLVELAELANSQLSEATRAGGHYVDFLPFCKLIIYSSISKVLTTSAVKYIPSWFPGAGFKKRAKEHAAVVHDLLEIPHNYVMSQLVTSVFIFS